jgi:hypothetical protein
MKRYTVYVSLMLVLLACMSAFAFAGSAKTQADVGPSKGHATVSIPANAVEKAPGVFSLGSALHGGKLVEGYAIVHYKEAPGKPGTTCGNGICEAGENARKCAADCGGTDPDPTPDDSGCYGFLAKGAKWRAVEPWVVNPTNTRLLDHTVVFDQLAAGVEKWDSASGTDVLGAGSLTYDALAADTASPDDLNEIIFADVESANAIAITIVWGIFSGPPHWRELVEWDQVYDDVDFDWSTAGEAGKMDFDNIATHELGHSVGMGDLYEDLCSAQTMYGYASEGETNKRSLESADIAGVQQLYN